MTNAKRKRLLEIEKEIEYKGILNKRPEDMPFETFKKYLELQKEHIKRSAYLVWNSASVDAFGTKHINQGTFKGNVNKYIEQQLLKNLTTK